MFDLRGSISSVVVAADGVFPRFLRKDKSGTPKGRYADVLGLDQPLKLSYVREVLVYITQTDCPLPLYSVVSLMYTAVKQVGHGYDAELSVATSPYSIRCE